ncbi:M20/M25/M40 family metallo-hydrolase [Sinomicrobium weinanense]|uniref:M20/M25/M40 family metallo-hydrolase n=1 Tax=Sinomicrobium weinanense TaxID=2842200 RepID=A0A926Q5X2_9FLAO|nr:M20/M25/M40 family metallo-hydrolase [Sinomicrobium weinanense]MBC9798445.1 M20/M25/M40 family metallo-hydrolase [Sinomicrobium weinanense]MBU3125195.1 M20/M25/M40 family metallo-hydrolase [Sinomicrobium weinanense]
MDIHKTIPTAFFALFFLCLFSVSAQDISPQPDAAIIQQHVNVLAADGMKGRGTGSKGLKKAARYIKRHFKKYGLAPAGARKYGQPFTAKVKKAVVADSLRKANNIIGFLDNDAPYTIIIGAHYDHLGMGKQGSSKHPSPEGLIHNGADDNASGVAGLLELARYFSQNETSEPYNFLFIAFSAEELGLLGSKYYVEHPVIPLKNIHFMLNMDMIGRYNPERGIGVGGYGTSSEWPAIFEGIEAKVKFFTDNAGSGGSDHGSFYAKQIPVLFFHTGGHPDYHMPSDDADKLNAEAEAKIIDLEIRIIENAMKQGKLPFTEVKN